MGKKNVILQSGPQAASAGRMGESLGLIALSGVPLVAGMAPLWCPSLAQPGAEVYPQGDAGVIQSVAAGTSGLCCAPSSDTSKQCRHACCSKVPLVLLVLPHSVACRILVPGLEMGPEPPAVDV